MRGAEENKDRGRMPEIKRVSQQKKQVSKPGDCWNLIGQLEENPLVTQMHAYWWIQTLAPELALICKVQTENLTSIF